MATLVPWWVRRANCFNIFSDNVGTVPVQPVTALEPRQGEMSGVSRAYLRRQLSEEGPRATVAARRVAHIKIPVGPIMPEDPDDATRAIGRGTNTPRHRGFKQSKARLTSGFTFIGNACHNLYACRVPPHSDRTSSRKKLETNTRTYWSLSGHLSSHRIGSRQSLEDSAVENHSRWFLKARSFLLRCLVTLVLSFATTEAMSRTASYLYSWMKSVLPNGSSPTTKTSEPWFSEITLS